MSPDWSLLSLAAITCVVAAFTPGPNNAICLSLAVNFGFRRALPFAFGVTVGFPILVFLTGLGLGTILSKAPQLHQVMKIIGILFLLYLSWKIATAGGLLMGDRKLGFFQAMIFQWLNPKAIVYALSIIATFVRGGDVWFSDVLYLVILAALVSLASTLSWAGLGAGISRILKTERTLRIFNITMGVLLAASAMGILLI